MRRPRGGRLMAYPFKQARRGNYTPRQGQGREIRYIVVHYTANSGDTARHNLDYFAREVTETSAHYFVDSREVCQSVLDTDVAWHCGSSHPIHPECRNRNSIGVEMCDSVGAVPEAVRSRTAAFVRELMSKYGVPPERVLRHYDVTGKRCPAPWVDAPGEWEKFKAMLSEPEVMDLTEEQVRKIVREELAAQESRRATAEASGWALEYIQRAIQAGILTPVDDGRGGLTIASPQGAATRQEMATMGVAILEVIQKKQV